MSQPPDDFMTADLAWISEWLLETATSMVESECEARGCSDWQLLQRRQEFASPTPSTLLPSRKAWRSSASIRLMLFNVHESSSHQLRHRHGAGLREFPERLDPGVVLLDSCW